MKIFFNNKYDSLFFINYLNKNYKIAIVKKNPNLKSKKYRNNNYFIIEFVDFNKYDFVIIKSKDFNINKYNYYKKTNKIIWIIFTLNYEIDYYYPSYNISKYIIKKNNSLSYNYIKKSIINKKNISNKLIKIDELDISFINY